MGIPDFQTLMLPLLRLSQRELSMREAVEALAAEYKLTESEREQLLPSGRQATFTNRVHWAKAYLNRAGLIDTPARARLVANAAGRNVLAQNLDRIDLRYLKQFPSIQSFRGERSERASEMRSVDPLTPEERLRAARDEIEAALATDLLSAVLAKPPAFFERLVVELLVAIGYGGTLEQAGRALGRSGDGGVDGVIDEDTLGLDRIFVQVKRYDRTNGVSPGAIRDFYGALVGKRASKGVFVTTSYFSPEAIRTAHDFPHRLVLIDGERLAELMIRYGVGCRSIETIAIKKIDEDFFDDD